MLVINAAPSCGHITIQHAIWRYSRFIRYFWSRVVSDVGVIGESSHTWSHYLRRPDAGLRLSAGRCAGPTATGVNGFLNVTECHGMMKRESVIPGRSDHLPRSLCFTRVSCSCLSLSPSVSLKDSSMRLRHNFHRRWCQHDLYSAHTHTRAECVWVFLHQECVCVW